MSNFKVSNNGGDDWLICWTGQDEKGVHWNVTTDQIHASQLHKFSKGAEEDARLIADLLNKHYSNEKPTESLDNLLHVVINESFTPEMEELGRRAKVEVMQLLNLKNDAHARLVELGMTMPCGHLARYAVNGEEGTQYCGLCHVSNLDGTIDVLHKTLHEIALGLDECEGCTCEMGNAPNGQPYHAIGCTETLAIIARKAIGEQ